MTGSGTGKTVTAAFDYRNFRKKHPGEACRLSFVAHLEEILAQSRDTFQGVLRDLNFGKLFVGNYVPENLDYLFISVQTINSQKLYEKLNPDYYDFIIVDEFHHASAPTYQKFLNFFKPKILLGLTATPERMDGVSNLVFSETDRVLDNLPAAARLWPQNCTGQGLFDRSGFYRTGKQALQL